MLVLAGLLPRFEIDWTTDLSTHGKQEDGAETAGWQCCGQINKIEKRHVLPCPRQQGGEWAWEAAGPAYPEGQC